MARARDSRAERLAGYLVLSVLAAISVWLLVQQSRFNPAVVAALRPPVARPLAVPQAGPATETAALLGTLPGLDPLSPIESFDPDTLSDKIDGKAELYLASNFREMSCRTFSVPGGQGDGAAAGGKAAGPAHVEVYLYAMDSARDAFAVFSGQRRSGSSPSDLTRNAYATDNAVFFTQGRYYVELVADRALGAGGTARAVHAAGTALAATLAAGPAGGGATAGTAATAGAAPQPGAASAPPSPSAPASPEAAATPSAQNSQAPAAGSADALEETALFPAPGLQAGTVRLTVTDAFGMEGLANVYTADYVLAAGEATAFLAARSSAGEARAQADAYLAFLTANGYREDPAGAALAGTGPGGAKLLVLGAGTEGSGSAWEVVAAWGRMFAGVHEATSRAGALELAAALGQAAGSTK